MRMLANEAEINKFKVRPTYRWDQVLRWPISNSLFQHTWSTAFQTYGPFLNHKSDAFLPFWLKFSLRKAEDRECLWKCHLQAPRPNCHFDQRKSIGILIISKILSPLESHLLLLNYFPNTWAYPGLAIRPNCNEWSRILTRFEGLPELLWSPVVHQSNRCHLFQLCLQRQSEIYVDYPTWGIMGPLLDDQR